jgi:thioredoxin 1
MSEHVLELTDATFDEQIGSSETAVVVDFWAEWCGPCKMVAPILEEIAKEHQGKVVIAKLNIDENPEVAMRYSIMSIPTMLVFKGGEPVDRIVGARPKTYILGQLEPHM